MDRQRDIIDESLFYLKPNVFFKTCEIQSNSDRVLIYLTLYITECLKRIQTKEHALAGMYSLAISRFDIPGEDRHQSITFNHWLSLKVIINCFVLYSSRDPFPLNAVYAKPTSPEEQDLMRQYMLQLEQECVVRVADRVFDSNSSINSIINSILLKDFWCVLLQLLKRTDIETLDNCSNSCRPSIRSEFSLWVWISYYSVLTIWYQIYITLNKNLFFIKINFIQYFNEIEFRTNWLTTHTVNRLLLCFDSQLL